MHIDVIKDNFPFISVIQYGKTEYVGIIINHDAIITTIYDFKSLITDDEKRLFLEMGEIWWWESNRTIPINIFIKSEMEPFKHVIRTLNSKDVNIVFGPAVSLQALSAKRSKRRIIQMVKSPKSR